MPASDQAGRHWGCSCENRSSQNPISGESMSFLPGGRRCDTNGLQLIEVHMVVIASKQVPVYFDVRFDFSIIKGHAYVK